MKIALRRALQWVAISGCIAVVVIASGASAAPKARQPVCFGDPDASPKHISRAAFDRVVGDENTTAILNWLKQDFSFQHFEDITISGPLICRIAGDKPQFLMALPAAGYTSVVHFSVANNAVLQRNSYAAYPYERYVFDKKGRAFLVSLLSSKRNGEYRFDYGLYDVTKMYGTTSNIKALRQSANLTIREPDAWLFGGIQQIDTGACWETKSASGATGIDIATTAYQLRFEDANHDGYSDIVITYDTRDCRTSKTSHHVKTFVATELGFKEKL